MVDPENAVLRFWLSQEVGFARWSVIFGMLPPDLRLTSSSRRSSTPCEVTQRMATMRAERVGEHLDWTTPVTWVTQKQLQGHGNDILHGPTVDKRLQQVQFVHKYDLWYLDIMHGPTRNVLVPDLQTEYNENAAVT